MKSYSIIVSFILLLTLVVLLNQSEKPKKKQSDSIPDTTYVDAYHVDSTGKYLIRWDGETVKSKPIKIR